MAVLGRCGAVLDQCGWHYRSRQGASSSRPGSSSSGQFTSSEYSTVQYIVFCGRFASGLGAHKCSIAQRTGVLTGRLKYRTRIVTRQIRFSGRGSSSSERGRSSSGPGRSSSLQGISSSPRDVSSSWWNGSSSALGASSSRRGNSSSWERGTIRDLEGWNQAGLAQCTHLSLDLATQLCHAPQEHTACAIVHTVVHIQSSFGALLMEIYEAVLAQKPR